MPIYEYECSSCQAVLEKLMKFSDPHPETCDECGKGPLTKLMSQSAFHLKGGGWYNEGYDSKSNSKPKEKSSDKKAASSDSSTAKPDTSSTAKTGSDSKSQKK